MSLTVGKLVCIPDFGLFVRHSQTTLSGFPGKKHNLWLQAACVQFYKRFIECPNFMAWFERRREAAAFWQVTSHFYPRQQICMTFLVPALSS